MCYVRQFEQSKINTMYMIVTEWSSNKALNSSAEGHIEHLK